MENIQISDDDVVRYASSRGLTPSSAFSRKAVQQIACPRCKAQAGAPCQGTKGRQRTANHLERCFERIRIYLTAQ